ncbi:putative PPPDE putative peptidase domain-containing protein [Plasmopara halstedii]
MSPRTAVMLNIYDLVEANDIMAPLGLGIYHSGVEIAGEEFSYASGAGIFSTSPRQAPGAKFRESINMGVFEGSPHEAHRLAYSLSTDFEGTTYNLFSKNCNTYADALCQLLLRKPIPSYINRAAYLGSFLSCLMPSERLDQAPVAPSQATIEPSRRTNFNYIPFAVQVPVKQLAVLQPLHCLLIRRRWWIDAKNFVRQCCDEWISKDFSLSSLSLMCTAR